MQGLGQGQGWGQRRGGRCKNKGERGGSGKGICNVRAGAGDDDEAPASGLPATASSQSPSLPPSLTLSSPSLPLELLVPLSRWRYRSALSIGWAVRP